MECLIQYDKIKKIVLDFIHDETGWYPLRTEIELEELTIMEIKELHDNSCAVDFEYLFNEDGFSKNDRTHIFVGNVLIGPYGRLIEKQLKETHRGFAAQKTFKRRF